MVKFVDVPNMARWIQRDGVENIIVNMVDYLERDYKRWEKFHKIPRVASHTPFGVIELMPTSDSEEYSFKYVNGHPSNPARGFQTVTAFGVLADVDNGYPTFFAEMTLLTALRTAATSCMVARHLARKDSRRMAMIGAGSQSEFQALGFRGVMGIEDIAIYDVDPAAIEKFKRNMEPLGFNITVCNSTEEAVAGADIITTCTADKAQNQILADHHVAPGVHLNAVGGDCPGKTELASEILDRAKVFVEFPEQTRIEGEIQQKPEDFSVVEFWKVLTGAESGRDSEDQITLFDSVGFAINDFSALRYLRDSVKGSELEVDIDIVADPEDPKDLFSLVAHVPSLI
ncbi:ornithine cyclodeaminase [Corynebacterium sp. sy039]|uniref:ornithine cyclodeaminase n=1 Tax=Corynebacterium sp. sy039 TaxID=2599641 RepID=UPI0011B740DA|nr:ornithine cyclodeaminase [Corynebacterium sp. sy039]QDZ42310.1 ornithine cyclodeaminase [Corynebacterium sp. sy039]